MKNNLSLSWLKEAWERRGAFFWLVNLLLIALIFSYGLEAWWSVKNLQDRDVSYIPVEGEGKVTVKPDVVKLTATVLTENASLKNAQDENTKRLNAVVAFLTSKGVKEKDIHTVGYTVSPQYSYPTPCAVGGLCPSEEKPRITGYEIRATLRLTVRDVASMGDILSGIVRAGANEVSDLRFTIDDPEKARAEAREKAIVDAREKADALARSLKKRVRDVSSFEEVGVPGQPPFSTLERGMSFETTAVAPPMPSLPAGENEVIVRVNITYEFK